MALLFHFAWNMFYMHGEYESQILNMQSYFFYKISHYTNTKCVMNIEVE